MFPTLYGHVWQRKDVKVRDDGWYSEVEFTSVPFSYPYIYTRREPVQNKKKERKKRKLCAYSCRRKISSTLHVKQCVIIIVQFNMRIFSKSYKKLYTHWATLDDSPITMQYVALHTVLFYALASNNFRNNDQRPAVFRLEPTTHTLPKSQRVRWHSPSCVSYISPISEIRLLSATFFENIYLFESSQYSRLSASVTFHYLSRPNFF